MRRMLVLALAAVLATACTGGGSPAPAPTPPRAAAPQPMPGASTYVAPPPRYAPSAPAATAPRAAAPTGSFHWYTRIAEAQADAQRTGRLILVGSTKPGCGLCEKFKTQVVPSMGGEVAQTAVGYMVDALSPEAPQVWQALRANLPNARLMPLVGIFSPNLQYLAGFGGPADAGQLRQALATARRMYPVAASRPVDADPAPREASLDGYEWSTPAELPAVPVEDALEPTDYLADAPSLPPAPPAALETPPEPAGLAAAPAPEAASDLRIPTTPAPLPAGTVPSLEGAGGFEGMATLDVRPEAVVPTPARGGGIEAAAARLAAVDPAADPATWSARALELALAQVRAGRLDEAKTTIAEIRARVPETPADREAGRGAVAIWNATRLGATDGREHDRVLEDARLNLGASFWGVLFGS